MTPASWSKEALYVVPVVGFEPTLKQCLKLHPLPLGYTGIVVCGTPRGSRTPTPQDTRT